MQIWHEEKLQNPYRFERGKLDRKRYHHWHEYVEILLILKEGAEGVVEGQQYRFSQGELLLFPPYCLHCIYCDLPEGADVCLMQCREDFLRDTAFASVPPHQKQFLRCCLPSLHSSLLQTAEFFLADLPTSESHPVKHWLRMAADVACRYGKAEQVSASSAEKSIRLRQEDMIAVCRYITEHIQDKLSVPELAAQAGYSVSHFSRIFHRAIGCGPGEYILRLKIREAQMLLCSSNRSVTEIAYHLQFSNPNNFSRSYRRILGHPPSEDRQTMG